ncbi:serine/threonine-protein kinase [Streptomyces sp. NPDC048717]|uniref:serine/threonine-protein kinase n=1 Tax=Streptomyces sp. NPDC048717 TaxID=3154928 RepID=UPI003425AB32
MLEALPAGPPRLVGPYRLLARLGAGGMGEVHLACRADAPTADPYRMVAVKTVREDLEVDGDFRTRFRREITAARAVDSPYAARLVDADADAAAPWLATEYVPGPSLAEAVTRAGALPVAAVRALGAALARALDAVHGAQVLHRDLKPANVLLGAGGPKLIDFGIAQAFEATALTSTGLIVGSPGFMSPEHLVGNRAVVPASDVFCLGAVLAFAASGRGPFHDDEMAAVVFRISRAEADLSGVPEEVRPLVAHCLRLDPAERPSAAELVGSLERSEPPGPGAGAGPGGFPWPGGVLSLLAEYGEAARLTGEAAASGAGVADLPTLGPSVPYSPTAVGARPAQAPEPVARRRPWGAITAGAVAVAVLATAGVVLLGRQEDPADAGAKGPSAGAGSPRPGSGSAAAPKVLDHVVLPYGGEGHTGDFGKAGTDRAARPAGWSPWATKTDPGMSACALTPKTLVCTGGGGAALGLRASDGTKVWSVAPRIAPEDFGVPSSAGHPAVVGDTVYVTGRAGVTAYGADDGKERGKVPAPGPEWAPKGSDLLDGVLYTSYLHRADESRGLATAVRLDGKGGGKELWRRELGGIPEQVVAARGHLYVTVSGVVPVALDAATGEETARGARGVECATMVVHRDAVLCHTSPDGGIPVLDADTLKPRRTLAAGVPVSGGPAVNADGTVAVVGGHDRRTLFTYDLASGRELRRAQGTPAKTMDAAFFAGDRVLASGRQVTQSFPVSGKAEPVPRTRNAPLPADVDALSLTRSEAVISGGALFQPFDGLIVSGYLP